MTTFCVICREPLPTGKGVAHKINPLDPAKSCKKVWRSYLRSLKSSRQVSEMEYEMVRKLRRAKMTPEELALLLPKKTRSKESSNGAIEVAVIASPHSGTSI